MGTDYLMKSAYSMDLIFLILVGLLTGCSNTNGDEEEDEDDEEDVPNEAENGGGEDEEDDDDEDEEDDLIERSKERIFHA